MRKKLLIILGVLVIIVFRMFYQMFFSMDRLPKGELLSEHISPNNTYTIRIYRCNGGATVSYAIRGEMVEGDNHKGKNIYWDYKIDDTVVKFKDDDTVIINNHEIELPNGHYDWRKE